MGVVSMYACIRSLHRFKTSVAYPGFNDTKGGSVWEGPMRKINMHA